MTMSPIRKRTWRRGDLEGVAVYVPILVVSLLAAPAAVASPPGGCLPDPGPGSVYLCDPLSGTSVGDVHGGQFVGDDGWQANVRADGIHYAFGQSVVEGHLSFWLKGLGDAALPNNDHIAVVMDNGPWADGDPDCRWAEIKIWGVVDPGQGTIFNIGGNFCGGPQIVSDRDHAFYDPSQWYHFEVIYDAGGASWRLDDVELATSNYACAMGFTDLYLPKRLDNQAEDPPIGAIYGNVSFVGTPVADPCSGDAHCGDGVQNCGETGLDCGVSPCADCETPADAGIVDADDAHVEDSGWVPVDAAKESDGADDAEGRDASADVVTTPASTASGDDGDGCGCRLNGVGRKDGSWIIVAMLGALASRFRKRRLG